MTCCNNTLPSAMHLPRLDPDPAAPFPPAERARTEPDGLLAWGGDLSPQRLMNAYRHGIFPWFSEGDPILWWSPDPRTVFDTGALHLSRRFRRELRRLEWELRLDSAFSNVVAACADTPRPGQNGTWITAPMRQAYQQLHQLGHAHSLEVFENGTLVGGIYGVMAGNVFCGESMFSHRSGASKLALAALCRLLHDHGTGWLDAQMHTPHLATLGARQLARRDYLAILRQPDPSGALPPDNWQGLLRGLRPADLA